MASFITMIKNHIASKFGISKKFTKRFVRMATLIIGCPASALAQPAFQCSPTLYQVLNTPNAGQLNALDPATATYTPIGTPQGSYNATAYNPVDNFIYALDGSGFVQIDATGQKRSVTLNLISGAAPGGFAGDFDTAGNYVGGNTSTLWLINNIDPVNLTADSRQLAVTGSPGSADLVYVPTADRFYGTNGTNLNEIDVDESAVTANVTAKPIGLADSGSFGAGWADQPGSLLFFNNGTGNIWQVTAYETAVPSGAVLLTTVANGSNDGMSCSTTNLLGDVDTDAVPNAFDADNDNDGVPNLVEGYADNDGDGVPNAFDLDSDNDGIPDSVEFKVSHDADLDGVIDGLEDIDKDTIPDSCDVDQAGGADTDLDDIIDSCDIDQVGGTDTDIDGIENSRDADLDGDGLADVVDPDQGGTAVTALDTDLDGVLDNSDLDADNDGIPDSIEAGTPDSDADGTTESMLDTDKDGIQDNVDVDQTGGTDSDLDGIDNTADVDQTGGSDTDGDGIDDNFDADKDGDGLADVLDSTTGGTPITPRDTDGNGTGNFQQLYSDNDTIPDAVEADVVTDVNGNGVVDSMQDTDGDSIPDSVDVDQAGGGDGDADGIIDTADIDLTGGSDTDGDGIDNSFDPDVDGDGFADGSDPSSGGTAAPLTNTDSDPVPDYLDLDSDNDGVPDLAEAGLVPSNPDNTDGDTVPDYRDVDSDNDGVPDLQEAGGTDSNGDGRIDSFNDGNGDGLDDSVAASPLTDADSDTDSTPDRKELDSDNDSINDIIEAGGTDSNSDGLVDGFVDADGDGYDDATEASPLTPPDTDGDSIPDFQDPPDTDGDGVADVNDIDDDNDGIPDAIEGVTDADGDGIPNSLDLDSDNDGIPDIRESGAVAATLDTDSDGRIDVTTFGVGANGLADVVETAADSGIVDYNADAAADLPIDTDNDGVPDFMDIDSDNDGLTDTLEAGGADTDGDGRVDSFSDSGGDGYDDSLTATPLPAPDTDGDSVPDFRDLDSDNDGVPDSIEAGGVDLDSDGVIDAIQDTDQDGIPDVADVDQTGGTDTDFDGIDDLGDVDQTGGADADNDGIDDAIDPDDNGDGQVDLLQSSQGGSTLPVPDTNGDGASDYIDLDSDGDGISDLAEAGGADIDADGRIDGFTDTDGDGLDDRLQVALGGTPLPLTDSDGNGIPDYRENAEPKGEVRTGLDAVGGCAVNTDAKFDPSLALLMVFAMLYLLRSKTATRLPTSIAGNHTAMLSRCSLAVILSNLLAIALPVKTIAQDAHESGIYAGAGGGISHVKPDTDKTDYEVDDEVDFGWKVFFGYDLNERISIEGYYADLGEATLKPRGSVDYRVFGVSGLYRFYHHDGTAGFVAREGLSYFGKIGVGKMNNDGNDVDVHRVNDVHLAFGLGAEYGLHNGYALRADIDLYDEDAQLVSVNLLKRF